ncbi:NnrS family protein [bacterium]|nr:NnrS family protein [bacterium]
MEETKKQYATSHYTHYPKGEYPSYLAYAFRPMFLVLAPYIVISIILWSLTFAGYISLPFINNILNWHMYEMIFGIGSAGIVAFFLTGAPELFPGTVPIVGKKLALIILLWIAGRIGFWFMDYLGIYFVGFLNVSLLIYITALVIKPLFADVTKRHISLGFSLVSLIFAQVLFFASAGNLISFDTHSIMLLSLGLFMVLILLALRRVNMEAINELLEYEGIDETFYARSPRYNLAIFCVTLYTLVEFFYPQNTILAYLALASAASILNILNDFILKDNNILFKPFIIYLMSILILMAVAYGLLGFDYLNDSLYALNHFRHFLTSGVFGMVFYVVMVVISTVHTGRTLFTNFWLNIGFILIILSTFIRSFIPYYEEFTMMAYISSSILWAIPFIIYMKIFFPYLLNKRADGIPG